MVASMIGSKPTEVHVHINSAGSSLLCDSQQTYPAIAGSESIEIKRMDIPLHRLEEWYAKYALEDERMMHHLEHQPRRPYRLPYVVSQYLVDSDSSATMSPSGSFAMQDTPPDPVDGMD